MRTIGSNAIKAHGY